MGQFVCVYWGGGRGGMLAVGVETLLGYQAKYRNTSYVYMDGLG